MADGERVDGIRPLPIWSAKPLTDDDYQRIREAKQSLGLPFLVQFGRAVPGGPSWRILAIGGKPDFITEYAEVPNTFSKGLASAIKWVLGDEEDSRAVTLVESLSAIFGEVKEVEDAGSTDMDRGSPDVDVDSDLAGRTAQSDDDPRGPVDPYDAAIEHAYRREIHAAIRDAKAVG